MIKRSMALAAAAVLLSGALIAQAQLYPYTGTSTAPSSTVVAASSTTSSSNASATATTTSSTMSSTITSTAGMIGEYLQIDGLVVASMPAAGAAEPVQIMAANPAYDTVTAAGAVMSANTAAVGCTQFATDSSPAGIATACPVPPVTTMTASTTGVTYYSPYMINVNAATQLEMSDRTPATLANITPGDTINVYGYYDGSGIINAEVLRDMSKPAGGAASTAALQAELDQLEALVAQLESALAMSTSTTVNPSLGTSLYCPMIAASGATSSVPCPPTGAPTTTASGTPVIYY